MGDSCLQTWAFRGQGVIINNYFPTCPKDLELTSHKTDLIGIDQHVKACAFIKERTELSPYATSSTSTNGRAESSNESESQGFLNYLAPEIRSPSCQSPSQKIANWKVYLLTCLYILY